MLHDQKVACRDCPYLFLKFGPFLRNLLNWSFSSLCRAAFLSDYTPFPSCFSLTYRLLTVDKTTTTFSVQYIGESGQFFYPSMYFPPPIPRMKGPGPCQSWVLYHGKCHRVYKYVQRSMDGDTPRVTSLPPSIDWVYPIRGFIPMVQATTSMNIWEAPSVCSPPSPLSIHLAHPTQ